jgi:putative tricarboxylic transport membrane protein
MRLHDALSGLLLLIFGGIVVFHARGFPSVPGHGVGAGFFPVLIGIGLMACALILMLAAGKRRDVAWFEWEDWVHRPRMALNGALVIGALVAYALLVDTVGFFITAFVFLAVLFFAFGVARRWIAPLAIAITLGLHFAFYTLLRVPLPWGWLERLAW